MRIAQRSCDCPAHRHDIPKSKSGGWSLIFPLLACAICPACLATYAKVLSVLGVGAGLTESQHLLLLSTAVLVSIVVSALRSWRSKRWWPIAFALSGAALIVMGHAVPSLHELEWAGVLLLLVGGLCEHFRLRSHAARHVVAS
jgi:hypothetical protein